MSTDTERERWSVDESTVDLLRRWYHVPALLAVVAFMFWIRFRPYDRFLREDGFWLSAVDSWYHWRTTRWTVEHYPRTMPFEHWTSFPDGRYVGQFGTLFDQIVATVAMVIGLGSPTERQILLAALITVPAMAALVAVPTFYIGRRLGGTVGGLAGVAFLALAPGRFAWQTAAGVFDHHVAEVLFMTTAVFATMVALRVAERDRPVYELVAAREWELLRRPAIYAALAGLAVLVYIWAWPSGVLLVGILGVYYAVQLSLDFVRGRSPDHVAFAGAVSMGVVAVGTLLLLEEWSSSPTSFGYIQPVVALLVAIGCLFMAWLARQWEQFEYDRRGYPVAIAGAIVAGLVAMAVVLPDLYGTIVSNLSARLLPSHLIPGLEFGAGQLTIAEAQPPNNVPQHMFSEFGLAFYTGLLSLALLALRPLFGFRQRAEHVLIVVWSLFLISMAMTQLRFSYYLIVAVAVLNAYLVGLAVDWIDLPDVRSLADVEGYQVLVIGVVVLVLFVPLLPPIAQASSYDVAGSVSPQSDAVKWEGSNDWVSENTPEVGQYGGGDSPMDPYGAVEYPDDGDFDYPDGGYGVLSWWDYGHLITVQSERIPHSNPFQSNARTSSAFLTAQSEERAELLLDAIAVGVENPYELSDEQLREEIEAANSEPEEIQYVMIDDSTAGSKFNAITAWTGPDSGYYESAEEVEIENETHLLPTRNEEYDDTMVSRLYMQDTNGLEHYRLVHESEHNSEIVSIAQFVDGSWQPLLVGDDVSRFSRQQRQQIYQLALEGHPNLAIYERQPVASVKTFERVEGATLAGQTSPNATVTVELGLTTNRDRQFVYDQQVRADEQGNFEVTVPYPTDEELTPEDGYANASVVAQSEYQITAAGANNAEVGTTAVPEEAVQNGEQIDVELEPLDGEGQNESEGTDDGTQDDGTAEADADTSDGAEAENETGEQAAG